jgi:uncharacterized protein
VTLVFVLGILTGAFMGLTGAGGGILAVPVLVAGMHWSIQQAAPVALMAVAAGVAVGAVDGFKHGLVRYKAAILMGMFILLIMAVPGIVATSLFVITLVGSGGVISALPAGAELPVIETSSFVGAMVSGMLVGRKVSRRLQAWQVQAFRR